MEIKIIKEMIRVNIGFIIIIVIFIILILLGLITIGFYNRILFRKNRVRDKFLVVYNSLKERSNMISRLAIILASGSYHEDNLIQELKDISNLILNNNSVNDTLPLINKSDYVLKKALSLESVHEQLKNNKEYISLQEEFKNNQYKIMYSIEIYNEEALNYNNYKSNGFKKLVSKIFKFEDFNYYKENN